jgi:adenosylhomocysteinase
MGHSNTEIDVESLRKSDISWEEIRLNVHHLTLPNGRRIVLIAEGLFYFEYSFHNIFFQF